jgi:hypothetical protein
MWTVVDGRGMECGVVGEVMRFKRFAYQVMNDGAEVVQ